MLWYCTELSLILSFGMFPKLVSKHAQNTKIENNTNQLFQIISKSSMLCIMKIHKSELTSYSQLVYSCLLWQERDSFQFKAKKSNMQLACSFFGQALHVPVWFCMDFTLKETH